VVLIGFTALIVAGIAVATNAFTAFVVGAVLGLAALVLAIWLGIMLSFAPVAIILEQKSIWAAITRSFALVRNGFWRVLGIRMLAGLVAGAIATAVAMPFAIAQVIVGAASPDSTGAFLLGAVLPAIGSVIGQIITAPFSAGVNVLLYTDRRIRTEAFDLVLRTGATEGPVLGSDTDHLWLTGR
jgi:membrane-anchored glycerophosphoryl diester phosphodiesterase (GDPDase)